MKRTLLTIRADLFEIDKVRKLLNQIKKKTGQTHIFILVESLTKLKEASK
jgi:hypothetical protein